MNAEDRAPLIHVVAAAIRDARGRYLLGRRRPSGELEGGRWEFPGGKVEVGESESAALARELREELTLEVTPLERLHSIEWSAAERTLHLHLWRCRIEDGEPRAIVHEEIAYLDPWSLGDGLCPADRLFLEGLEA